MPSIYPSLIAADQLNLAQTIDDLRPYCAGYHLDVMDGRFVPNFSWRPDTVNSIVQAAKKRVWIHLMVERPDLFIEQLQLPHNSIVTFHIENLVDTAAVIGKIAHKGWLASLAISPKTPLDKLFPYLPSIELALIMSVEPGYSGQPFIPAMISKARAIAAYKTEHNLSFAIGMDGGINESNIEMIAAAGVEDIVVGAGIFAKADVVGALMKLNTLIRK